METLVLSTTIGIFLCFREISSHFLMFVGQVNDTQMAKKKPGMVFNNSLSQNKKRSLALDLGAFAILNIAKAFRAC